MVVPLLPRLRPRTLAVLSEAVGSRAILEGLPFPLTLGHCSRCCGGHLLEVGLLLKGVHLLSELPVDLFVVEDDAVHGILLLMSEGQFVIQQFDGLLMLQINTALLFLHKSEGTSCVTLRLRHAFWS